MMQMAKWYVGFTTRLPLTEVRERLRKRLKRINSFADSGLSHQLTGFRIEEGQELGSPGEKYVFIGVCGIDFLEEHASLHLPKALLNLLVHTGLVHASDPRPGQHYFWPMSANEVESMLRTGSLPLFLSVEK